MVDDSDKELALVGKLPRTKRVRIKCPQCGYIYIRHVKMEVDIQTNSRLRVCPKCMLKNKEYNHKSPSLAYPQWFIDQIVDPYIKKKAENRTLKAKQKVEFRCPKGHLFTRIVGNYITLSTMQQRTECPICTKEERIIKNAESRLYPEWFISDLHLDVDKTLAIQGKLKTTDTVLFECSSCHFVYSARVGDHIKFGTKEKRFGCPVCGVQQARVKREHTMNSQRTYPQWFIDELAKDSDKDRVQELKSTDIVEFKCEKGHIYKQLIGNHISIQTGKRKSNCPVCYASRSKTELEIDQFIQSLGFSTEHTRFRNPINPTSYFEIDIYIPEKKIGIEYNGSFFHKTSPDASRNPRSLGQWIMRLTKLFLL